MAHTQVTFEDSFDASWKLPHRNYSFSQNKTEHTKARSVQTHTQMCNKTLET